MGSGVADAAVTLRRGIKAAGSGLAPSGQPGSAAGVAARTAETAWVASMDRITARVDRLGRKMAGAADSYQVTDQAGADELRRSGSQAL
jgi:hypothetical protein